MLGIIKITVQRLEGAEKCAEGGAEKEKKSRKKYRVSTFFLLLFFFALKKSLINMFVEVSVLS